MLKDHGMRIGIEEILADAGDFEAMFDIAFYSRFAERSQSDLKGHLRERNARGEP